MERYVMYKGYEIIMKRHAYFVGRRRFWSMTEAQQYIDDIIDAVRDKVMQREIEEWY